CSDSCAASWDSDYVHARGSKSWKRCYVHDSDNGACRHWRSTNSNLLWRRTGRRPWRRNIGCCGPPLRGGGLVHNEGIRRQHGRAANTRDYACNSVGSDAVVASPKRRFHGTIARVELDDMKPATEKLSEWGYAMVVLLVSLSVMAVMMSVAMPVWKQTAQREKETELVFRGEQYARAIALFQRKHGPGTLPPSINVLVEERFI